MGVGEERANTFHKEGVWTETAPQSEWKASLEWLGVEEQWGFSNPCGTPEHAYPRLPLFYVGRIKINAPFSLPHAVTVSTYTKGGWHFLSWMRCSPSCTVQTFNQKCCVNSRISLIQNSFSVLINLADFISLGPESLLKKVCVCLCVWAGVRVLYDVCVWRSTNTILTTFPCKTPFFPNYKIHALCEKSGSTQSCKRNNHEQQFGLFLIRFLSMHVSLKSCGIPPTLT